MLERHLENGSASRKISPHMLAFDHQPRSPIDMLIRTGNNPTKVTESASQYLETTVKESQELS